MDTRPYVVVYHGGWEPRLKNIHTLPHGTGCRYLKCLIAHNGDLVAISWHRKEPELKDGYMAFRFP